MAELGSLDISTLFSVRGIVAVVTGGGSGIGSMIARALDAIHAEAVYIIGRREAPLQEVAKSSINGRIIPLVGDVTSKDSLGFLASKINCRHGYIDVLFANSGVTGANGLRNLPKDHPPSAKEFADALWEPGIEGFMEPMRVNVAGVYFTCLAFLELLDAGNTRPDAICQKSQIIITTSLAGFVRNSIAGLGYNSSKAAANHLVKVLATYLVDFQIRVNGIAPGLYMSEIVSYHMGINGDATQEGAVSKDKVPMLRAGGEMDMAGAALFLTSPAGGYIDGNILVTDGGKMGIVPGSY